MQWLNEREVFRRDRVWPFLLDTAEYVDIAAETLLFVEDVSVNFDGFQALNHLSLSVQQGELRCLIGANGAGKTTLMDVITGKTACDTGKVFLGQDTNLLHYGEPEIANLGVGRKFQKPSVFEALTVIENLELALKGNKTVWQSVRARLSQTQVDHIHEILCLTGLQQKATDFAGTLSHGEKQWLEIAMLLTAEPRLLLIDEPVAGMTPHETEKTAELFLSLAGDHTLIVVEHDMDFVKSIARTVTVLHQGTVLAEGEMHQVQNNPAVIEVYLGESS